MFQSTDAPGQFHQEGVPSHEAFMRSRISELGLTAFLKGAITMCEPIRKTKESDRLSRRGFLTVPSVAAAAGLLVGAPIASSARADALTREQRDRLTPE